jgi:tRNA modification GTPase
MQTTIVAQATPAGRGGVSVIRISGPKVSEIANAVLKKIPQPRYATFNSFYDANDQIIDQGIALYFPAPNSFTGEDILELHGHGGPVIIDCLLRRILNLGAQMARPGEFSERAFLNNKMDLTQAEAVADLIDAASEQAARSALRSLQGEFSQKIDHLVKDLIYLRMHVEAAIDFPEEEIDFLSDGKIANELQNIIEQLSTLRANAKQGALLRDGMTIVIAGKPNAGKSSLLNQLSCRDSAIVTEIPGTTRDVLREQIVIDGMPLHIIDTAGLRESDDVVEREGVRRAQEEIIKADKVLLILDSSKQEVGSDLNQLLQNFIPETLKKITVIYNKIDLIQEQEKVVTNNGYTKIFLSAKTGSGLNLLREYLKQCVGFQTTEDTFIARARHVDALNSAYEHLLEGKAQLLIFRAGELLAEELFQAQKALSEITGEFHTEDLLDRIFSSFCIGK